MTLVVKSIVEWKSGQQLKQQALGGEEENS
jgi:hypothetical protein